MTIDEHIIANDVLRRVKELLPSTLLQSALEIQTAKGMVKYPNLVNVDDYDVIGWIDHNIQELIDSTVYYVCLIGKIINDYGIKGTNSNILNILESNIENNVIKLQELELIRTHYSEVA